MELGSEEVFVFSSDASGMHHAGAAGIAMHGSYQPTFGSDEELIQACGGPEAKGRWTALGQVQGAYKGKDGNSFAVQTRVDGPRSMPLTSDEDWDGKSMSKPLGSIRAQLERLCAVASKKPEFNFLVTPLGQGKSGYTAEEIGQLWAELEPLPENIRFLELTT